MGIAAGRNVALAHIIGIAAVAECQIQVAVRSESASAAIMITGGFAEAAVIVEDTFRLPMVYQSYMEPMACTVVPDPAGSLTVYASTQALFDTRREVALALGLPWACDNAAFSGKATTNIRFSEPGDYVLHVTANDYSGEGGGGFQCCWTTGLVKVSVK